MLQAKFTKKCLKVIYKVVITFSLLGV